MRLVEAIDRICHPHERSRSQEYLPAGRYDIGHKPRFNFCHRRSRTGGIRLMFLPDSALLAGSPYHFTDPLAGLLVNRPGEAAVPRFAVGPDLLENHPPEPSKNGGSKHWQQDGFRFLSHSAILLTATTVGQSSRRRSRGSSAGSGAARREYRVHRQGR